VQVVGEALGLSLRTRTFAIGKPIWLDLARRSANTRELEAAQADNEGHSADAAIHNGLAISPHSRQHESAAACPAMPSRRIKRPTVEDWTRINRQVRGSGCAAETPIGPSDVRVFLAAACRK